MSGFICFQVAEDIYRQIQHRLCCFCKQPEEPLKICSPTAISCLTLEKSELRISSISSAVENIYYFTNIKDL